ncbi:glycosyltransferase family 4 protein [Leifsonia sp. NPDC077715]|uniref:glycosyltransferase family 4 protein n=1 Tax=Leifsonia sp. NPDC077715 TaxID=3155539 RepID=UPI00342158E7
MSTVFFAVPDTVDDPERVSGGNVYDRRLVDGLEASGWEVRMLPVPERTGALRRTLAGIPDDAVALVDGLLVARETGTVAAEARRLRCAILTHMIDGEFGDAEHADYRAARQVIATSGWTRGELIAQDAAEPNAITVAHPGTDEGLLSAPSPSGGRLLCVGAVAPHKGQDLLVEALSAFSGRPDWTCTVAGSLTTDPGFVAALRARIDAAGLADRVVLTGVLGGDALAEAYARADLVVQPSRLESYGMAVADALAHGIPVLATEVGGLPEAIGVNDAAMIVPPGDPWAIRVVLQRWWASAELRRALQEAALRARGARHTWPSAVEAVTAALRRAETADSDPAGATRAAAW